MYTTSASIKRATGAAAGRGGNINSIIRRSYRLVINGNVAAAAGIADFGSEHFTPSSEGEEVRKVMFKLFGSQQVKQLPAQLVCSLAASLLWATGPGAVLHGIVQGAVQEAAAASHLQLSGRRDHIVGSGFKKKGSEEKRGGGSGEVHGPHLKELVAIVGGLAEVVEKLVDEVRGTKEAVQGMQGSNNAGDAGSAAAGRYATSFPSTAAPPCGVGVCIPSCLSYYFVYSCNNRNKIRVNNLV